MQLVSGLEPKKKENVHINVSHCQMDKKVEVFRYLHKFLLVCVVVRVMILYVCNYIPSISSSWLSRIFVHQWCLTFVCCVERQLQDYVMMETPRPPGLQGSVTLN